MQFLFIRHLITDLVMSLLLLPFLGLVTYYIFYIPIRNAFKFRGFNSFKTVPILGNALQLYNVQHEFNKVIEEAVKSCGSRFVVWFSYWFPLVVLGNSKDAKKVLSSREHVQKGFFYRAFDPTIGTGAFNSPVGIWKERRPHFERAFHSKVLQRLPPIFDKCAKRLIAALEADGFGGTGKSFDCHYYFNLAAIHMLIEGALGIKVDPLGERKGSWWKHVNARYNRGTYLSEYRVLRPWFLVFDWLWNLTPKGKELTNIGKTGNDDLFSQFVVEGKRMREELKKDENENSFEGKSYPNFLQLLLELRETKKELNLNDGELTSEMASIYIAGHDASGKSLSFTLLYLGFHPSCQDLVAAELDPVFPDPFVPLREEDLGKLKYLEACIKEAFRLMPPVALITRRVGADVTLDSSAVIPKGTEVAIATYLVHRDPEIYPEPEKFRPERFLENAKGRDPYSWIPFSAGPRNCLGPKFAMMEDKIVLANLLRNYRVESVGAINEWVIHTNVTLNLEGGWNVRLFKRT